MAVAVNVVRSSIVVVVPEPSVDVVNEGEDVDCVGVTVLEDDKGVVVDDDDVDDVVGPSLIARLRAENDEQFAMPGPLGSEVVNPPTTVPAIMP